MKTAVRFYSKTGNTEKLARIVADRIQSECKDLTEDLSENVEILFMGSSVYAGKSDPAVKEYIRRNREKIGMLAVFGTSAILKKANRDLREYAEGLGLKVAESFRCPGRFGPMHDRRPDDRDREHLLEWADRILADCGPHE